jgi:hypothetical protein
LVRGLYLIGCLEKLLSVVPVWLQMEDSIMSKK